MGGELQFPLTFAAAKRAEKTQWAIGDALLEEIGPPRAGKRQDDAFRTCAKELAEAGMPYQPRYLMELRLIAYKFDLTARAVGLTARNAMAAGTPAVYEKAVAQAEADGVAVTQRQIEKVRKATKRQERKAKAKPAAPARDKSRVTEKPTTALRREIDVAAIELTAKKAERLGRDFVELIAGVELSKAEKADLREDIDAVIKTWQDVRDLVANPLMSEIEDFLGKVG